MIEVYSNNVSVPAGATVPLDNEVLRKGCTATKSGNTINLNRCGVYQVNCECSASAAGTLQLQKNTQWRRLFPHLCRSSIIIARIVAVMLLLRFLW